MISQVAYFLVQSLAFCRYFFLSVLKILATSGINGSSGFGSVIKACNDNNTLATVNAGDHCDLRISKHIAPLLFIFG